MIVNYRQIPESCLALMKNTGIAKPRLTIPKRKQTKNENGQLNG
jgi:hypothetical protein